MTRMTIAAESLHDPRTRFLRVFHRQVQKFTFSLHVSTKGLIETLSEAILWRLNKIGKNPSLVSTRGNLESDCKQVFIFYCLVFWPADVFLFFWSGDIFLVFDLPIFFSFLICWYLFSFWSADICLVFDLLIFFSFLICWFFCPDECHCERSLCGKWARARGRPGRNTSASRKPQKTGNKTNKLAKLRRCV